MCRLAGIPVLPEVIQMGLVYEFIYPDYKSSSSAMLRMSMVDTALKKESQSQVSICLNYLLNVTVVH